MIRPSQPKKYELFFLRAIILFAFAASFYFLIWFFNAENIENKWLFGVISIGVIYRILRLYHQWVHLFFLFPFPFKKNKKDILTVDVFTTFFPGEPYEMVENTLLAIKRIDYPHQTILCSEGDDERLQEFCKRNDIQFIPRYERTNAKAGNINNGLSFSESDICVILDPDHIPERDFIDVVLPYFEDEKVGFVQVPQIYYNQNESLIATGAAQQTYEFYGPLMMAMNSFGTAQAIGANCTFRRKALDSIGGHAPGLTEDMHTSMLLHAKGWKSVFVPETVSKGLVPVSKSNYFDQQLKWSRGAFDLLINVLPRIFFKLSFFQKLHYLSIPLYFLFGLFVFFDFLVPVVSLFSSEFPLRCRMDDLIFMLLPLVSVSIFIKQYAQKWLYTKHEQGVHYYAEVMRVSVWWVNVVGLFYTLINKKVPYIPTNKNDKITNEIKLAVPNMVMLLIIFTSIFYGYQNDFSHSSFLMIGYLSYLALNLVFGVIIGFQVFIQNIASSSLFRLAEISLNKFIKLSAFLMVILATWSSYNYFNFSKHQINSLEEVEIPDMKKNNGFYFANSIQSNVSIIDISEIEKNAVDTNNYVYIKSTLPISDTNELKEKLNNIKNIYEYNCSSVFLDLLKIDTLVAPSAYKDLWRFQYEFCLNNGLKPIFVFSTHNIDYLEQYFPDPKYVNWLNFRLNDKIKSIHEQFENDYHTLMLKNKPILISNVNNEIKFINDILAIDYKALRGVFFADYSMVNYKLPVNKPQKINKSVKIKPHKIFTLDTLKGVYYNVSQDWKDDFQSLTSASILNDFTKINTMGANVVLRYGPTIGDKNILNNLQKANLKLLYGFNISPKTNFLSNKERVRIKKEILNQIKKHQTNNIQIIGYCLGNEVLGELENYYVEPILYQQRIAYLSLINEISSEITHLPTSIHFSVNEKYKYFERLCLKFAANLDYIGLNINYFDDFEIVSDTKINTYIAHFGVDGASDFSKSNILKYKGVDGELITNVKQEVNDVKKSEQIINKWNLIKKNYIGGFVDCWTDKMDVTFTWNGLTDYKGRFKPQYYALKNNWTDSKINLDFPSINIKPNNTYFEEDSTYYFDAFLSSSTSFNQLEWVLCKNDNLPVSPSLINIDENGAFVTLPNDKDDLTQYRLFLFVSDGKNVTTSSYFIPVRWYFK